MNIQVLDYKPFKDDLEELVSGLKNMDLMFIDEKGAVDHLLTWDIWKCKILECARKHNRNFKQTLNNNIKNYKTKLAIMT